MAFASLYIGDSQTMAAEAGVLGVPFVRFNDFVGRIGYLRELEDKYKLGYGIHATPLTTDSPIRRADGGDTGGVEQKVEQYVEQFAEKCKLLFCAVFFYVKNRTTGELFEIFEWFDGQQR